MRLDFVVCVFYADMREGASVGRIGIGGGLAVAPLPHHRAYGSVLGGSVRLSHLAPLLSEAEETKGSEVRLGQPGMELPCFGETPGTLA